MNLEIGHNSSEDAPEFLVLNWRYEIHSAFVKAKKHATYVLDRHALSTEFESAVRECQRLGVSHIVVENLDNVGTIYALVSLLLENRGSYRAAFSCDEKTQYAAAIISQEVFCDYGAAKRALYTKDKRWMKNLLRDTVHMADHFSVATHAPHGRMDSLPKGFDFPIVIKPVNRYGSSETYLVEDIETLNKRLKEFKNNLAEFICEEFISGPEYNVDVVWKNGDPLYFFVGEYIVPRLYGYENRISKITTYLPRDKHGPIYDRFYEEMRAIGRKLDIRDGVTHAEFFINAEKTVLGEIATRHAGGGMSYCIQAVLGEDLIELGLRTRLDYLEGAPAQKTILGDYIGFIDLRPHKSGVVVAVISEDELAVVPGVVRLVYRVRMNHHIEAFGRDSWCVLAIVSAPTKDLLHARMQELQARFWCRFEDDSIDSAHIGLQMKEFG